MCRIVYSYLSVVLLLFTGCASDYKLLQPAQPNHACSDKIAPREFQTGWYDTGVDVMGNHISGLVLIKTMPDSSKRVVFTNEAGLKFFDFEFSNNGTFQVHYVIDKLNRKSVIHTLQKDFELMLGIPFRSGVVTTSVMGNEIFYGANRKGETAYFITSKDCASLHRLEWRAGRKRMVSVNFSGDYPAPDSLQINHDTFNMQISLKRIPKE